MSIVFPLIVN